MPRNAGCPHDAYDWRMFETDVGDVAEWAVTDLLLSAADQRRGEEPTSSMAPSISWATARLLTSVSNMVRW